MGLELIQGRCKDDKRLTQRCDQVDSGLALRPTLATVSIQEKRIVSRMNMGFPVVNSMR